MNRVLSTAALLLLLVIPHAAESGNKINLAPSGGDDTAALQAALDAASSGPRKTIRLSAGTFRISRPLLGINSDVVIRGAGMAATQIIADGSFSPDGLFQQEPLGDTGAIQLFRSPVLFLFTEKDTDVEGRPVATQRSVRVEMRNLTLGARGLTVPHFDISAGTFTQRMFSHVWMEGYRGDWTNSAGKTPGDIGMIDAEHAVISTIRAKFAKVHFDGRNRDRADNEPGGAFDPNPDVRNALGVEGGFALIEPLPDPVFFFKPINAEIEVTGSLFTSIPGQAGLFAPQLVGRDDPAWTYGADAVRGSIEVRDTVFEDVLIPIALPDLSAISVRVTEAAFWHSAFGILVPNNSQATNGVEIGYPASAPSSLRVHESTFGDSALASVLVDDFFGPSLADLRIADNHFVLVDASQTGIFGVTLERARISDNEFTGQGYAAIAAIGSTDWQIAENEFCDLDIPPSAQAALGLPPNVPQAPVVLLNSTGMRVTNSECASFFQLPEDPSNTIGED
jgi:hypothetical protein